jgi:hypothetical protein
MNTTIAKFQPEFVSSLILGLQTTLSASKHPDKLIMTEPNYGIPTDGGNMERTSLRFGKQVATPEGESTVVIGNELPKQSPYSVHLSHAGNILENGEIGHYIVFETAQGKLFPKTVTRQYVSEGYLEGKLIQVALRRQQDAIDDIVLFLNTGKVPQ